MDMLELDDLSDEKWLEEHLRDMDLSPQEAARFEEMMSAARAVADGKDKLRALRRKKEDLASGPSQKISIRIPRPILDLLKAQAALRGLPYQTYLNHLLHNAATR